MIPVVYINCKLFPFVAWILAGKKIYETRNRNTLKNLIGKRVYIAMTGKGKAVILCMATIESCIVVDNKKQYNAMRKYTRIVKGSVFDWQQGTKKKYLYRLVNVVPVPAFPVPADCVKHGRTWAEFIPGEQ